MNLKAIVASLVLGSSSLAAAAPAVTVSGRAQISYGSPMTAAVVRDHRTVAADCAPAAPAVHVRPVVRPISQSPHESPPIWVRHQMHRPVLLASDQHFARDGRAFITVPGHAQKFSSLQISAAGGRSFISQVYIEFDNGQEQIVRNLDTKLTGNQSLTVDLDGARRSVRRVVVYGKNLGSGWRTTSGFTLTAI